MNDATPRPPWWRNGVPFYVIQIATVLALFFVDLTWEGVAVALGSYVLRMFGITAGYHRYFAHRGFKTGRGFQFVLAFLGSASAQKGVLWWSGHHVDHHRFSDTERDLHSPKQGFWWSHLGWMMVPEFEGTPKKQLDQFAAFPELVWLNHWWVVAPVAWCVALLALGGWTWVFWGFFVSTLFLWHGTFTINSLAHVWGRRRYATTDTSRNNFWLSLITLGEGWHNNHHHYPSTANQGFFWWEVDMSYVALLGLERLGVVWDLRRPPGWVLEGRARRGAPIGSALVQPPAPAVATAPAAPLALQESD
ncbi:MAG: acyl-CoA desaturase [Myxococcota bacterium]